mmetsp:Transcript_846/g.1147  ORF Transcript_846/g.1147 Transcript_846/m.1147 type:complete len:111 (-) Transcript_846:7047-7379(-)
MMPIHITHELDWPRTLSEFALLILLLYTNTNTFILREMTYGLNTETNHYNLNRTNYNCERQITEAMKQRMLPSCHYADCGIFYNIVGSKLEASFDFLILMSFGFLQAVSP